MSKTPREFLLNDHPADTVGAPPPATDMLRGMPAIARFLGVPTRAGYYAAETGVIPSFKLGVVWCMRKSAYFEHIASLERANLARPLPQWRERQQAKAAEARQPVRREWLNRSSKREP